MKTLLFLCPLLLGALSTFAYAGRINIIHHPDGMIPVTDFGCGDNAPKVRVAGGDFFGPSQGGQTPPQTRPADGHNPATSSFENGSPLDGMKAQPQPSMSKPSFHTPEASWQDTPNHPVGAMPGAPVDLNSQGVHIAAFMHQIDAKHHELYNYYNEQKNIADKLFEIEAELTQELLEIDARKELSKAARDKMALEAIRKYHMRINSIYCEYWKKMGPARSAIDFAKSRSRYYDENKKKVVVLEKLVADFHKHHENLDKLTSVFDHNIETIHKWLNDTAQPRHDYLIAQATSDVERKVFQNREKMEDRREALNDTVNSKAEVERIIDEAIYNLDNPKVFNRLDRETRRWLHDSLHNAMEISRSAIREARNVDTPNKVVEFLKDMGVGFATSIRDFTRGIISGANAGMYRDIGVVRSLGEVVKEVYQNPALLEKFSTHVMDIVFRLPETLDRMGNSLNNFLITMEIGSAEAKGAAIGTLAWDLSMGAVINAVTLDSPIFMQTFVTPFLSNTHLETLGRNYLDKIEINPTVSREFTIRRGMMREVVESAEQLAQINPDLGRKLDYVLGKATGHLHNIERSQEMLRQMERIGFPDSPATRAILSDHLRRASNDPSNILRLQENGRIVRESLLAGPNGVVKVESIWDKNRLITVKIFGKGK